MIYASPAIIS